jgi:serine/threonine-protein kinase
VEPTRVLSDRYALISHLARGGMADVWVAEDRLLGRQVAVKILHDQYAKSEAFVERFRREAQAAANLSHSNIVAVHDWGQDEDTYFMVMELVQGRNLRDVLRSEGALLPRRVAEIGAEVCVALSVAHNQGIVHRDIKPANVLLTSDSAVKVADFGIARAWDDSENLTKTGAVIGTATYFSPEQAQGQIADARSDLYSVGVVMYELLAAQPPFSGESPVAVAYQHVQETPQPLSTLNPNVPPGLEAIVAKAMSKEPADRYQSAVEMVEDIDRLLAGQIPLASPQNEAATRMMQDTPAPVAPATAATAYQSVQQSPYEPTPLPVSQEQPLYREPGAGDRTTLAIGVAAAFALLILGIIMLVRLLGSESPDLVTIPELAGNQPASAIEELTRLGLSIEQEVVANTQIAAGLVVGTDPAAGSQVERGTLVKLLISGGDATIQVPRLIDLTEDQARTAIELSGLEVGELVFEASPVLEAGIVMGQDPEAGTLVAAGTEVNLVISAGTNALVVPDVVGKSEADALFVLSQSGFTPEQIRIERQPSADVLAGFVIETTPEAEQFVPIDGFITVVISEGAVPSVIPSVIGDTATDAREALEELGFIVLIDDPLELEWDDPLNGFVAEQSPAAGATAEFGSTVRLRVGEAASENAAPNVIGDNPTTAKSRIEAAGFIYQRGPDIPVGFGDPDNGTVQEQAPPPGTLAAIGSTMTVRVAVAGSPVSVPDLIGDQSTTCMTEANAVNALNAVGLVPNKGSNVALPFGHPCHNRVYQQSPAPLTAVAAGTQVTYQLGAADPGVTLTVGTVKGQTVAQVQTTYPSLTWTYAGVNCHDPAGDGTKIGASNPVPGTTVATGSNVQYWLAENNGALTLCTALP